MRYYDTPFSIVAGKLTDPVGRALAGFPVEPWMGKVLLAGAELGCSQEALTVVAMAATDPIWLTPRSAFHEDRAALSHFVTAAAIPHRIGESPQCICASLAGTCATFSLPQSQ